MLFALAAAPVFWVAAPETKLRPDAPPSAVREAVLEAGRGECQAFQLALRAGAEPLTVDAEALPFAPSLPLQLSREAMLDLRQPSGPDGQAGVWPDPLIPDVDAYAGERRNAFPAAVPANGLLAVWAEVCASADAPPGTYRTSLALRSQGQELAQVPVTLHLHAFAIPATSSLPTSFGISLPTLLTQHAVSSPQAQGALLRRYAVAALRHRLSLHGMSMQAPPFIRSQTLRVDFSAYDAELAPLLDGPGARFTSTDVRLAPGLRGDAETLAYLRASADHLRARGWLDRAFLYAADEPSPDRFAAIAALGKLAHQAGLRVLVTVPLQASLAGAVDLWTPNLNCLVVKRDPSEFCPLRVPQAAYAPRLAHGEKLWWYLSCSSHGCGPIPPSAADYFRGWPDYAIDVPGDRNRAMGPLAYRYAIDGELYYDTVEAYRGGDPWTDVYRFGGNGDGTLFYPGTPARIGGTTDVPIESLRLKLIRAGLQDYEELVLLRKLGDGELADALAEEWVPRADRVEVTPARREALRARLLARLDRLWVAGARAAR